MAGRIAVIPENGVALRLRERKRLDRRRLIIGLRQRNDGCDRNRFGHDLALNVVGGQRLGTDIVLEREQSFVQVMVDFQPIVTEKIALVVDTVSSLHLARRPIAKRATSDG